jgi:hypothetical protein
VARHQDLLTEIEQGALDSSTELPDLLRKCVALGGATGSADLRAWATKELKGYDANDEFPPYRTTHALLFLDAGVRGGHIKGQQVPYGLLPDEIEATLQDDIHIHQSVAEIADLISARRKEGDGTVKLSPPGPQELVALLNYKLYEQEDPQWRALRMPQSQVVERVYWQVNVSFFVAILDTIRTTLVELIAEMRAGTPAGESLPSPAVADQAFSVAVRGNRNRVIIQQPGPGGSAAAATGRGTVSAGNSAEPESFWRRWMWWIVGLATIVAAVAAVLALLL